jgi:hypothetical protein
MSRLFKRTPQPEQSVEDLELHQLRLKSKAEFNKFEQQIPELLQCLRALSHPFEPSITVEHIADILSPKIKIKYGLYKHFSMNEITIEPKCLEFEFEDRFKKTNQLTANKASKLLQNQLSKQHRLWSKLKLQPYLI